MLMNKEAGRACLFELADILEVLNIPFFLMQGTALGAHRDKGFVPAEKDIDLGILQEHLTPRSHELLNSLIAHGFDTETFSEPFDQIRTLVAFKYNAKTDLVGMTRWKDYRFTATPVRPWVMDHYALVHDAKIIETQEPIEMFGRTFMVPSPIETYLEREYGPGWRTPADDHVSRTRVQDFLTKENIPRDYLNVD